MKNTTRRAVIAAAAIAALLGGAATANALDDRDSSEKSAENPDLVAHDFQAVNGSIKWQLTGKLKLNFPTYHTEGIAFAGDRVFLSAVQVTEPTTKYPSPQGRYDRTPGKGIGHVFVMDRQGNLQKDVVLGEGDMYHPAGMDFDGKNIWVPVAEYRPNSSAIIYSIDATTLEVHKQFEVADHIGGIIRDAQTGHLIGNNWGSRRFYEWDLAGHQIAAWDNPSFFGDYQDCQHLSDRKMICGGTTNLPQTPAAGGTKATYELGGIGLTDLRSHDIVHEVPFQQWSTAGHVATRNPFKIAANGNTLTLWVAPDNGDEGNGTEILTYQATVNPTY
ncbi:DUF6454 family protein [Saccharopolyspora phatthalungensis]|uniref:Uncharacterized protein n=1 Tax=Saccharopolyspora phatthalungensis TaxID=664693 RepID=A0A840QBC7_9PSEU|nr:DUF6454 family protein [Saccharopolyspora phatthalungensis]MBB5157247.1 hypothetical protein [Saccharopolyspora phatthalungensis]